MTTKMMNQYDGTIADFDVAYKAIRDAEWLAEPDNPTNLGRGIIQRGDTIWFHPDHFGSGPVWQQARLSDKTLRYVHLDDFKKVIDKAKGSSHQRLRDGIDSKKIHPIN